MKGYVYWITGLSGAGKTTVGNALYYQLKETKPNTIILDGDVLKKLVGSHVGYSREERKERAKFYSNMCRMLSEQGINVIICTISMFDEVRRWNRENIINYIEIYLDVPLDILIKRNKKGLYHGKGNQVAGLNVEAEFPKNPDLVICNDGDTDVGSITEQILACPCRRNQNYIDNTAYWDSYYTRTDNAPDEASSFAQYILKYTRSGQKLIDLGCGNGRDSIYFLKNGLAVTGVDMSMTAVKNLREAYRGVKNARFICGDFITSRTLYQEQFDICYSRFTLHAISSKQEDEVLKNIKDALNIGGYLFVEARTVHDEIYGKGDMCGKNEFIYDNHYRRFIDLDEFKNKLLSLGCFEIVELTEGSGVARYKDSDPTVMRCIARKNKEII